MGHGLEYFYRYTRALLDASLLLGVPDHPTGHIKAVAAALENDETVSMYPLLAAYGLLMLPDKTDTQARAMHRTYGLSHDEHDPAWALRRKWNTPCGSRDATLARASSRRSSFSRCTRRFARRDSTSSTSTTRRPAALRSLISNVARAQHDRESAFARKVLNALEARGAQLRFVTGWFETVFGDLDLSLFGDPRARQLYAAYKQRRCKGPRRVQAAHRRVPVRVERRCRAGARAPARTPTPSWP